MSKIGNIIISYVRYMSENEMLFFFYSNHEDYEHESLYWPWNKNLEEEAYTNPT